MKIHFSKNKISFIFIFISLIIVLGNLHTEVPETGLSLKVVFLFSITFLMFVLDVIQNRIMFFSQHRTTKILFSLFAISIIIISVLRDGLLDTYLVSILFTIVAVLVMVQFMYRLSLNDAIQLFLEGMFILLLVNLYAHYINNGTFQWEVWTQRSNRLLGFLGGGLAGALAGLSAIFSIIIVSLTGGRIKKLAIVNMFLSWLVMLMSDNRTSIITCSIINILIILAMPKTKSIYKVFSLLFIIGIILFIRFYTQQTLGGKNIINDSGVRVAIWNYGFEQITNSPLFGYGKLNPFSNNYEALKSEFGQNLADPHNSYLYFVLRNGLIVSFFYLLFITSFLITSFRRLKFTGYGILFYIPIYWLVISFTGGDYFNFRLNFSSIIFGISLFGFLNHPELKTLEITKLNNSGK